MMLNRRRTCRLAALLATLALTAAACGSTGNPQDTTTTGDTSVTDGTDELPIFDEGDFVGLGSDEAAALADQNGHPWRVARNGDEHFVLTDDLVAGRVTFEIDSGDP